MQQSTHRKRFWLKALIAICLLSIISYGAGRLYFAVTGGFTVSNITSEFAYDPRWEMQPRVKGDQPAVGQILSQEFTYLGKGCQSYVFLSKDGHYVVKFFKYQRFRPQFWLRYFTFIPAVATYYDSKIEKKQRKLDDLFLSWKIAYEELIPETGLVYVHLNRTTDLPNDFVIYDKIGQRHVLDMNQMEFLVQKRADMLCTTIKNWMAKGDKEKTQALLSKLVSMVILEYHRGLADNDHALMQNTGVYDEQPIHIDVGQFVKNEAMKNPALYHQELFNKTYKFRVWLKKHYPELLHHLERELKQEIGNEKFDSLKHIPKIRD